MGKNLEGISSVRRYDKRALLYRHFISDPTDDGSNPYSLGQSINNNSNIIIKFSMSSANYSRESSSFCNSIYVPSLSQLDLPLPIPDIENKFSVCRIWDSELNSVPFAAFGENSCWRRFLERNWKVAQQAGRDRYYRHSGRLKIKSDRWDFFQAFIFVSVLLLYNSLWNNVLLCISSLLFLDDWIIEFSFSKLWSRRWL